MSEERGSDSVGDPSRSPTSSGPGSETEGEITARSCSPSLGSCSVVLFFCGLNDFCSVVFLLYRRDDGVRSSCAILMFRAIQYALGMLCFFHWAAQPAFTAYQPVRDDPVDIPEGRALANFLASSTIPWALNSLAIPLFVCSDSILMLLIDDHQNPAAYGFLVWAVCSLPFRTASFSLSVCTEPSCRLGISHAFRFAILCAVTFTLIWAFSEWETTIITVFAAANDIFSCLIEGYFTKGSLSYPSEGPGYLGELYQCLCYEYWLKMAKRFFRDGTPFIFTSVAAFVLLRCSSMVSQEKMPVLCLVYSGLLVPSLVVSSFINSHRSTPPPPVDDGGLRVSTAPANPAESPSSLAGHSQQPPHSSNDSSGMRTVTMSDDSSNASVGGALTSGQQGYNNIEDGMLSPSVQDGGPDTSQQALTAPGIVGDLIDSYGVKCVSQGLLWAALAMIGPLFAFSYSLMEGDSDYSPLSGLPITLYPLSNFLHLGDHWLNQKPVEDHDGRYLGAGFVFSLAAAGSVAAFGSDLGAWQPPAVLCAGHVGCLVFQGLLQHGCHGTNDAAEPAT